MNREDIIRMAQEAGFNQILATIAGADVWIDDGFYVKEMERFAALVAAAEREACAKACDQLSWKLNDDITRAAFTMAADTIRARGEEQPYATQAAMVESQTHGRMQIDPATGNVSIGAIRARG